MILITGTNRGFEWLTVKSCAVLGHEGYATMRNKKGPDAYKLKPLEQIANIVDLYY